MTGVISLAFLLALIPLVSLLWTVIGHGIARFSPYFFTTTMRGVYGGLPAGGIAHALVGTLWVTAIAAAISVPIGLMCAIFLTEYARGPLAKAITFFVDVMTGIPSIVAGLFAYALFTILVGPAYSAGIIGSVGLSVLMIPVVVRSSEEMLRLVPRELRESALALGVPKWLVTIKVVVRTAAPGIVTGVMLAIARVIGETAPLLLTVGAVDSMNLNPFSGRMETLPVYIYNQFQAGLAPCRPGQAVTQCLASINYDRSWSAALVLILLVMIISLGARVIAMLFNKKKAKV